MTDEKRQARQDRVMENLEVATYPFHVLNNILQILAFAAVAAIAIVWAVFQWWVVGPEQRAKTIQLLNQQTSRSFYVLDFGKDNPELTPITAYSLALDPVEPPPFCDPNVNRYANVPSFWHLLVLDHYDLGWAEGKSSPMYGAYVRGVYSIHSLRTVIGDMKAGVTPVVYSPCPYHETPEASQVDMSRAPVINMMFVGEVWDKSHGTPDQQTSPVWLGQWVNSPSAVNVEEAPKFMVIGLCVNLECKDEDGQFRESRKDIIRPILTHGQQHAVNLLNLLSSDQFWLAVAHDNGIHDDAKILEMAQKNRDQVLTLLSR
jgi:hypothetical protein